MWLYTEKSAAPDWRVGAAYTVSKGVSNGEP